MSKFSSIGAAPEAAEPQVPKQPTMPPVEDSVSDTDFVVSDGTLGDIDDFIDLEREIKGKRPAGDAQGTDTDTATATGKKASWYQRMFGNKDGEITDGPEAMDTQMSDEMYQFSSSAAADMTDALFSRLNHTLHRTGSLADHEARPDGKERVRKAWELYMRWKQMVMTPGVFLVFTIFLNYGINTIFGVFRWVDRCRLYGWHWPWSDAWIAKAAAMYANAQNAHQNARPQEPAPVPMDSPAPPTTAQQADAEAVKRAAEQWDKCLETGEPFLKGEGFPGSSKNFPELVGKFKNRSAMMSYMNRHNLSGQQVNSKKGE